MGSGRYLNFNKNHKAILRAIKYFLIPPPSVPVNKTQWHRRSLLLSFLLLRFCSYKLFKKNLKESNTDGTDNILTSRLILKNNEMMLKYITQPSRGSEDTLHAQNQWSIYACCTKTSTLSIFHGSAVLSNNSLDNPKQITHRMVVVCRLMFKALLCRTCFEVC